MNEMPAGLTDAELRALPAGEQVDLLVTLERQRRRFEAAQVRLLAVMQARDDSELNLVQEEVSLALQVPLRTAQLRLAQATTLVTELPRTLAAVADGALSAGHANVLVEAVWRMPAERPELPAALEARVLPGVLAAGTVTVRQLHGRVRCAVLALDPATAEQRHQRALAERRVEYRPEEDGMAGLYALLPAPEARLIYTRLTTATRLLPPEDPRTLDQKRADLFVDGLLSGLPVDALPTVQGRRPAIQVTVAADTLLGLNDQPAHLTGYGPITAQTARRLAADESGTWRRLLTDPDTGALLDISPHRYRPPQRLWDYLSARDDVCAFPTCQQPGYRCEADHIVPFDQGGPTRRDNLALTCRRHNQAKTTGTGWHYRHNPDGSFTWTTPTGHHYTSPATRPQTDEHEEVSRPNRPPGQPTERPTSNEPPGRNDPPPF